MKKRAFLFDFDGVILNTEPLWEEAKKEIFSTLFGEDVLHRIGNTVGMSMIGIHAKAKDLGAEVSLEKAIQSFHSHAPEIYKNSPITPGINDLKVKLTKLGFTIGIVSASPRSWLDIALNRLSWGKEIKAILTLADRPEIEHKPSPQGYIELMKILHVKKEESIALEDSNSGITSAKSAGVYTIGYSGNLVPGQTQTGADIYANSMDEVSKIVEKFL